MAGNNSAILVVEDEPDICWALERVLDSMGYVSATATNGKHALRLTKRRSFRLALVDAKLPDVDGIELAEQLQKHQPDLPVILISGYFYEDDDTVQQSISTGSICGFVGKPFALSQVREAITRAAPNA